jgi:hypothetical protein
MAELALNTYAYADSRAYSRPPRVRILHRDEQVKATRSIKVARLEYRGNWNPEPGGWERFAILMHNQKSFDIDVRTIALGESRLTKDFALAHLTGTERFQLDENQRDELKKFVAGGGTLVIDSAGGGSAFADAARAEMTAIFGEDAARQLAKPLPPDHAIYGAAGPDNAEAEKITDVEYRQFTRRTRDIDHKAPRFRGIDLAGRTAIFFSPEDVSVALLNTDVDGVDGYEPQYASALLSNLISHAAHHPADK